MPAESMGMGTLLGSPRAHGTQGPRAWQRSSQRCALGRCGPDKARGAGHALLSPWDTVGRGKGGDGGTWLVLWEVWLGVRH